MVHVDDYFRSKRNDYTDRELKSMMRHSLVRSIRMLAYGTLINRRAFDRSRNK